VDERNGTGLEALMEPEAKLEALADLYRRYVADPASVDAGWRGVFDALDDPARAWLEGAPATIEVSPRPRPTVAAGRPETADSSRSPAGDALSAAWDSMHALMLIRAYRVRGHLEADLDPLGLVPAEPHPDLDPASYGFGEADLDRPIYVGGHLGLDTATLREIVGVARRIYCGKIGIEFMHIQDPDEKQWIQDRMEGARHRGTFKPEVRRSILEHLTAAEAFERFLDRKYTGTKRFGLDGGESTLAALETIVRDVAQLGVEELVIGMSHRGRLNVLANLMGKPLQAIFSEFQGGASTPDEIQGSGDVMYHLGASSDREIDGRRIHLSLTPNPSHLEAVNPVVIGKVRAKQDQRGDRERKRCMALLIHGDAAFAGQGVVSETLEFCDLEGYRTGGSIHLIVNNQIGFTTSPVAARTGPYCTDVAKANQAPIIHVNGDDPEAVVEAAELAVEYRHTFANDVVIDLFCYRRYGHNEGDEPAFTQPLMYRAIAEHPTTRELYANRLVESGVVGAEEVTEMAAEWERRLTVAFEASNRYRPDKADWLQGPWSGLVPIEGYDARRGHTEAPIAVLREVGEALTRVPEDLAVHPKILRQLRNKRKMFETGEGLDWATAEALAFGSLLVEGHPVRLSGEDCNRGTFSQRHASWIDQQTERRFVPLNHIREHQERFEVVDSPLSEFGVLGFEYGYAMAEPRALVLWEAQFGDFANGAQIVIDQFLAAGESKWLRMSGLVLLLPHGYEGQGPEHSSARLERFLQLCAEDNLQVVNCTTPANYFHALRRQMHREFRKPLVVMTPKSLLRNKRAVSSLADFGPGSRFRRVMYDDVLPSDPRDASQLVLCSGKLYYELLAAREERGAADVHLLRLEQLYPFPSDSLAELLLPYRHCHLVWCQEEPRNMGAWEMVSDLISEVAEEIGCERPVPRYAGRPTSASTATGLAAQFRAEQERLLDEALRVGVAPLGRIAARKAERKRRHAR
jgi:2-oxoglutarate dehydrogenase E1 component